MVVWMIMRMIVRMRVRVNMLFTLVPVNMDMHQIVRLEKWIVGKDLIRRPASNDGTACPEHMNDIRDFFNDM